MNGCGTIRTANHELELAVHLQTTLIEVKEQVNLLTLEGRNR
jgi:hypothetical protein